MFFRKAICISALSLTCIGSADDLYWTGNDSTDWFAEGNWNPSPPANLDTNVFFDTSYITGTTFADINQVDGGSAGSVTFNITDGSIATIFSSLGTGSFLNLAQGDGVINVTSGEGHIELPCYVNPVPAQDSFIYNSGNLSFGPISLLERYGGLLTHFGYQDSLTKNSGVFLGQAIFIL